MITSISPCNTSPQPSSTLTKTKTTSLPKQPLNRGSRPTAITADDAPSSRGSSLISSSCVLQRERFLVQHTETFQYLSGAVDGHLTWTDDPRQAFRFTLMETVLEQLKATREFYKVPDVQVVSIVFTIDPNQPCNSDAWEVSHE